MEQGHPRPGAEHVFSQNELQALPDRPELSLRDDLSAEAAAGPL